MTIGSLSPHDRIVALAAADVASGRMTERSQATGEPIGAVADVRLEPIDIRASEIFVAGLRAIAADQSHPGHARSALILADYERRAISDERAD